MLYVYKWWKEIYVYIILLYKIIYKWWKESGKEAPRPEPGDEASLLDQLNTASIFISVASKSSLSSGIESTFGSIGCEDGEISISKTPWLGSKRSNAAST